MQCYKCAAPDSIFPFPNMTKFHVDAFMIILHAEPFLAQEHAPPQTLMPCNGRLLRKQFRHE